MYCLKNQKLAWIFTLGIQVIISTVISYMMGVHDSINGKLERLVVRCLICRVEQSVGGGDVRVICIIEIGRAHV